MAALWPAAWAAAQHHVPPCGGRNGGSSEHMRTRNSDGKFAAQDAFTRFTSRIEILPSGCWHWTGPSRPDGYGSFSVGRKTYAAHRYAFQLANGIDPAGFCVCHRCDNPPCVNPAHLFLGTTQDNIADKLAKGRQRAATGEAHGSKTHPERVAKGSQLPQAKVSEADIPRIRKLLRSGKSQASIGRLCGLSPSMVGKIARREAWGWVP